MTVDKGMLGWGELTPADAIAVSNAFAAIKPARCKEKRLVVQPGQAWLKPSYRTLPTITVDREIERLTQIPAEMRRA